MKRILVATDSVREDPLQCRGTGWREFRERMPGESLWGRER